MLNKVNAIIELSRYKFCFSEYYVVGVRESRTLRWRINEADRDICQNSPHLVNHMLTKWKNAANRNTMEKAKKSIGQRIKQSLENAGLTQRALADELGVSAGSVSGYVKGLNEPSATALAKIANFCGVSLGWLITGENATGKKALFSGGGDVSLETDGLDPQLTQMVMENLRAETTAEELKLTAMEEAIVFMIRHLSEKDRQHVLYTIMGAWALAQKKTKN